jgi:uncharacterized DUF497 family protein
MSIRFRWHPRKDASNLAKHSVSFDEARTVFGDPLAQVFADEDHSESEFREIIIGMSRNRRLMVVCFTERPDGVRIISARPTTPQERHDYEENVTP